VAALARAGLAERCAEDGGSERSARQGASLLGQYAGRGHAQHEEVGLWGPR